MRKIEVLSMRRIKKAVPLIENRVKVRFSFGKSFIVVEGPEFEEYLTSEIVRAIDFGFNAEDSLLLLNPEFVLEFIDIKNHTRRKNLKDVRARLIGTNGKARKTLENLTGSVIVIKDNSIGVIVDSKHLDSVVQAIESLIQGSKHGNVFSYLEKQNSSRRGFYDEDLGLKKEFEKMNVGLDEEGNS